MGSLHRCITHEADERRESSHAGRAHSVRMDAGPIWPPSADLPCRPLGDSVLQYGTK